MRKVLWAIFLFGLYIWAVTSGHDQMIIQQVQNVYRAVVVWFDDAEVDFQVKQTKPKSKKKARRWD